MFLDLNTFEEQLSAVEREEEKMPEYRKTFFRISATKSFSDVDDISTEALCFAMLYSDMIVMSDSYSHMILQDIIKRAVSAERIRSARLL